MYRFARFLSLSLIPSFGKLVSACVLDEGHLADV